LEPLGLRSYEMTVGKWFTHVSQSQSSVIWYQRHQPKGNAALWLGRWPYVWRHAGHCITDWV